ncbi:MAG: hypothetical protein JW786_00735 [Desulfobacterales bacterium]|nr:hypothetical protein [Desulfobacterales bacterium]
MKRHVFLCKIYLFLIFVVILTMACGGGGGGGSSSADLEPATIDQNTAAQAVGMLGFSQNLTELTDISSGMLEATSATENQIKAFPKFITPTLRLLASRLFAGKDNISIQGSYSEKYDCEDGGIISESYSWTGPDEPEDCSEIVDLKATIVADGCKEWGYYLDGQFKLSFLGDLCQPYEMNISYSDFQMNFDEFDIQSDSLKINLTDLTYNPYDEIITHMQFTINGDISGSYVDVDENYNIALDYKNFSLVMDTVDGKNITFSISGAISGDCFDGWVTYETLIPVRIDEEMDCPTTGKLKISGDGSMIVTFNEDGSVDVGDVHYNSCNELPTDCTVESGKAMARSTESPSS